jgi:hypothetical protein
MNVVLESLQSGVFYQQETHKCISEKFRILLRLVSLRMITSVKSQLFLCSSFYILEVRDWNFSKLFILGDSNFY